MEFQDQKTNHLAPAPGPQVHGSTAQSQRSGKMSMYSKANQNYEVPEEEA
jgi:hypothetical protein